MTKNSRPRSGSIFSIPLAVQPSGVPFWAENDGGLSEGSQNPLLDPTEEELLTAKPHPNSFRAVVAPLLVAGHFMGILPASAATSSVPSFRWTSVSVLFSMAVMVAVFLRLVVFAYSVYYGFESAIGALVTTRLGFTMIATLEFALYIQLATRWRLFVLCFLKIEHRLGEEGLSPKLRSQMIFVTVFIMTLAAFETVLQVATVPRNANVSKTELNSAMEVIEDHYKSVYNHVNFMLSFTIWSWIYAEFTTFAANIILNYNDVFLIMVSMSVLRRIRLLRERMFKTPHRKQTLRHWRQQRETFNELSQLTRNVDHYISALFLLSCLNNLFSVCIQLRHTVSSSSAYLDSKYYFVFSFVFVLIRSGAVVYSASDIHSESKLVKQVLYSVPPSLYNQEVKRFLIQVTTDEISFTGLGLFTITRSFILKMLGTIVTYEILLVQMNRHE